MKVFDSTRWPRLLPALLLGVLALGAASCGQDSSSDSYAKVRGRLVEQPPIQLNGDPTPEPTSSLSGTAVVLGRVRSDGTIEVVSREAATVDAEGRFVLETELDGVSGLVVQATQGDHVLRAIVTAEVERGGTIFSPPLDVETTVEADLYARIVSRGAAEVVSAADVTLFVDSALAAKVHANAMALERLATAIEQSSRARLALLAGASFGLSSAQIRELGVARLKARAALEASLNAAADGAEIEQAYAEFVQAEARAFAEVGIRADGYARERTVTGQALVVAGASLPADARLALTRSSATVEARAMALAVESEWTALDAGPSKLSAIGQTGVTLRADLQAAADEQDMGAAFDEYHDVAIEGLEALLSTRAQAVADADVAINAPAGPRRLLEVRLGMALTTEAVASSYQTFFTTVHALATAELPGLEGPGFDAALAVLTVVNMNVVG